MKTKLLIVLTILAVLNLHAHGDLPAAPKGGKLFTLGDQFLEFFVNGDRVGEVTIYDSELKPVEPGDRELSVTAGSRSDQVKLDAEKTAGGWTTAKLPDGDGYFVILQVKDGDDATTLRVNYLEEVCSGCDLPEYACTCDH